MFFFNGSLYFTTLCFAETSNNMKLMDEYEKYEELQAKCQRLEEVTCLCLSGFADSALKIHNLHVACLHCNISPVPIINAYLLTNVLV